MNALLKAAIAWRDADDGQQLIFSAMTGGCDYEEWQRLYRERERMIAEFLLPAERALHLAIEQAEPEADTVAELLRACHAALDALGCDRVRQERLGAQKIIHAAIKAYSNA